MVRWVVFTLFFGATVELASRIEQWVVYGAPILGVYTYDSALFTTDEFGIRGKSNGSYEKWHLNTYGFRGPEVLVAKDSRRLRIVCIGASETFGLYESANKEWPRQLESFLTKSGMEAEVINAALAGMSLPQRTRHLENRLVRFSPDVVVFMLEYGSYAGLTPEKIGLRRASPGTLPERKGLVDGLKSLRTVSRLKDILVPKLPEPVQEAIGNMERRFKLELRQHELGPRYRSLVHVQPFEVEAFTLDLEELYESANAAGIKLVFLSPAMWFTERNIATTYLSWPFVDESWWREAKATLPVVARQFAAAHHVPFLDLSDVVEGHEADWMKDMLHFNDLGAEQVSQRVASLIRNGHSSMAQR
jgi:lysophospholipase L1-like esterase